MGHRPLSDFKPMLDDAAKLVEVGAYYTHYKTGDEYEVVNLAILEVTEKIVVSYQAQYGDKLIWIRELDDFTARVEKDGDIVNRFTKIEKE